MHKFPSNGWRTATVLILLLIGLLIGVSLSAPAKAETRTTSIQAQGINPGFITKHSPLLLVSGNIECRAGAWTLGPDKGSVYQLDTWVERLWESGGIKRWVREYPELVHYTGNLKYDAITIVPFQLYGHQTSARYRCGSRLTVLNSKRIVVKRSGIQHSNARTFYVDSE